VKSLYRVDAETAYREQAVEAPDESSDVGDAVHETSYSGRSPQGGTLSAETQGKCCIAPKGNVFGGNLWRSLQMKVVMRMTIVLNGCLDAEVASILFVRKCMYHRRNVLV